MDDITRADLSDLRDRLANLLHQYGQPLPEQPEDPVECLCDILNWTDQQAQKTEAALESTHGMGGIVRLLRELGAQITRHQPGPIEQTVKEAGVECLLPLWEDVRLSSEDLDLLLSVANESPQWFDLESVSLGKAREVILATQGYDRDKSHYIGAARALWPILEGKAQLLRCPAPAPDKGGQECGRYFVSGGRVGYPARYCSETCRKRAHRRKVKMGA